MISNKDSHIENLLNSFKKFVGYELIPRVGLKEDANFIENCSFVLVSHDGTEDPILNYGNIQALKLWELSWDDFVKTPSRKTAEPELRSTRQEMLAIAKAQNYFDNYSGVRISSSGRRFEIKKAIIWTVVNNSGEVIGQAATFSDWKYLN